MKEYDITNINLAAEGRRKIEWAAREMGVLKKIEERFRRQKPLRGLRVGACLHVTTETARLAQVLQAGGAQVALAASNPLSTKDDVAASLVKYDKIFVFACHGENRQIYYKHLRLVLNFRPHITMDDGADLASLLHTEFKSLTKQMIGSTEETTTGVIRLRALEKENKLLLPVIAVNDAQTKHLFDNHYGTGQSAMDGIIRATNVLLAGKVVAVAGYGWCGKGVAKRAAGLGSRVIVSEAAPVPALQAVMDGYALMPMAQAAAQADVIITTTGNRDVVNSGTFSKIKSGCIIANAGHFDVEIDVKALKKISKKSWSPRSNVTSYQLTKSKIIHLLADGRLVNLAAAEGHPSSVMDMSFAGQALSAQYLVKHAGRLDNKVHVIPKEVDDEIAAIKLTSLGKYYDRLTPRQKKYLHSWGEGT